VIPTWLSVHLCFAFEAPHWQSYRIWWQAHCHWPRVDHHRSHFVSFNRSIISGTLLANAWTSWLLWISKLHNMSWWCRPVEWRPLPISANNKFSVLLAFPQLSQWLMRIYKQFLLYQMSVSEEEYDRWQALRHVIILHLWIATGIIFVPDYTSKSYFPAITQLMPIICLLFTVVVFSLIRQLICISSRLNP